VRERLEGDLPRRVAGSALTLAGRSALISVLGAGTTAIVARLLGVGSFGELSSALAAYALALAATDFGFSLVLGRELAVDPAGRGRLWRANCQVQGMWGGLLGVALLAMGLWAGLDSARGQALVVLALLPALGGLGAGRQVFLVLYRTRELAAIDLAANVAQAALVITVAALGGGVFAVVAAMAAASAANALLVGRAARRMLDPGRPAAADRRALIRRALPLGLVSVIASAYFTIDLALLGWLVPSSELGQYAAACKILSILVLLPALVLTAALPGLAATAADRARLGELAARLGHWLAAVGLPLCVGTAVFADPLVQLLFGSTYADAVPLVRILSLAGAVALLSNAVGTILVAQSRAWPMLAQNAAALALNVVGNVLLVPRHGVVASAWITVATELVVCVGGLFLLRGRLRLGRGLSAIGRSALAALGFGATGWLLASWPALALPSAAAVLVLLLYLLRAWPSELWPARWRAART
jgi:O-antigen/teichoic acid export membrane protein